MEGRGRRSHYILRAASCDNHDGPCLLALGSVGVITFRTYHSAPTVDTLTSESLSYTQKMSSLEPASTLRFLARRRSQRSRATGLLKDVIRAAIPSRMRMDHSNLLDVAIILAHAP